MEYLLIGTIVDTFSLDGTLKVFSTTNNIAVRYKEGNKLLLKNVETNELVKFTVEDFRMSGKFDYVKFKELNDINEALKYKGFQIVTVKDYKDLDEGYFFYSDLTNCTVIFNGEEVGLVSKVEDYPAHVSLIVKQKNGKTFQLPFVKAFIKKVDIENKVIEANIIEGML